MYGSPRVTDAEAELERLFRRVDQIVHEAEFEWDGNSESPPGVLHPYRGVLMSTDQARAMLSRLQSALQAAEPAALAHIQRAQRRLRVAELRLSWARMRARRGFLAPDRLLQFEAEAQAAQENLAAIRGAVMPEINELRQRINQLRRFFGIP